MTDAVEIALIVAIAPTIASVAALLATLHNGKKAVSIEEKVISLDIKVDGRLTELLKANNLASNMQGRQDERELHGGDS